MLEDIELEDFPELLQKWHEHHVKQLQLIVDQKDADLQLGDAKIKADSEMAKGIRYGVEIALLSLGKLPFSVSRKEDTDEP